jgi:hypothetical protein
VFVECLSTEFKGLPRRYQAFLAAFIPSPYLLPILISFLHCNVDKRRQYNEAYKLHHQSAIQLLVTKSDSWFDRNTLDGLLKE